MGADVYLRSKSDAARAKYEPLFNEAGMYSKGYFRDNYNPYGLFAQLGLSW